MGVDRGLTHGDFQVSTPLTSMGVCFGTKINGTFQNVVITPPHWRKWAVGVYGWEVYISRARLVNRQIAWRRHPRCFDLHRRHRDRSSLRGRERCIGTRIPPAKSDVSTAYGLYRHTPLALMHAILFLAWGLYTPASLCYRWWYSLAYRCGLLTIIDHSPIGDDTFHY